MIGILFIVIAVVMLFMRSLISPSKNVPVFYTGIGTITKRIQEDCRINFYVEFCDVNGKVHTRESVTYKSTKGKYYEGDSANIKYYFTPKGISLVRIDDDDLVSCEQEAKPIGNIMLIAAIVLIVLGVICLVSHFVMWNNVLF